MYRLEVSPAADRDLDRLKKRIQRHDFERLRIAIRGLADEPRPQRIRKIRGAERAFRIRVSSYRVVYEVYDNENLVLILQVLRQTVHTVASKSRASSLSVRSAVGAAYANKTALQAHKHCPVDRSE